MADVLLVRDADSPGYTRFLVADPITGEVVADTVDKAFDSDDDGKAVTDPLNGYSIQLEGQREFDVPGTIKSLTFPDGSTWKPTK